MKEKFEGNGVSQADASSSHPSTATALLLTLVGFALSMVCVLSSPDGVLQFDDLTHFLYAKWAWQWPTYILDEWGRPGFTALYFLPAGLGWPACKLLSAGLAAACAWMAFRIAQRLDMPHAWAAVIFAYVQPLFFQLSQTTLTEMPLAFYLTLGVYLALKGRWTWSAAVVSLCAVTRHEAVIFLPVWFFFAWRGGARLHRLWPIVWAPIAVNLLAWAVGMRPPVERLFDPEPSTQYGQGGWLTFFARGLHAWGPGVMVLAATGFVRVSKHARGGLVAACILIYFAAQTAVRALGLYDSGGYARFLVPISPLLAVAALAGWRQLWRQDAAVRRRVVILAAASMLLFWLAMERQLALHAANLDMAAELHELYRAKWAIRISTIVFTMLAAPALAAGSRSRWSRPLLPAGVAGMILMATYALCGPLPEPPEAALIDGTLRELERMQLGDREIISANVWLDYATRRQLRPDRPTVRAQLVQAPVGTLFAWERQFAPSHDHQLPLEAFARSPSFDLIYESPQRAYEDEPYLRVFAKVGAWDPSPGRDEP